MAKPVFTRVLPEGKTQVAVSAENVAWVQRFGETTTIKIVGDLEIEVEESFPTVCEALGLWD